MKATGIIRRIDDLGRVVIPKEIRHAMDIQDGDPLEIFIEQGETVCFKKYDAALDHTERLQRTIKAITEDYEIKNRVEINKKIGEAIELLQQNKNKLK